LADVLRHIPRSANPNLLVGFETSDDAGVFRLSATQALVQTVDFFTPIVDDPYAYGQIAAANSLSDIYAMGGTPLTVLNLACFNPTAAPAEVWAEIIRGMYDKTTEAGAVVMGGHTIEDNEPKFGMAVTGIVDPTAMFVNTAAAVGDEIWLTKPLGTGIVTTAAKADAGTETEIAAAIELMSTLNRQACETGLAAGVRCATDITGFGLAGHLFNIAKASDVEIEVDYRLLPKLPGVERMIAEGYITGGGARNRSFIGDALSFAPEVPDWIQHLAVDPQTSGGLALFSRSPIAGGVRIGSLTGRKAAVRFV
jgi:selenide,water dikinase